MINIQHCVVIVAIAGLLGCSAGSDEVAPAQNQVSCPDTVDGSWRARYLELGGETYEMACASCHDPGGGSAPTKGDRDSWSNRSPLWSAVLFKHAKSGYGDMPSKGGMTELSDKAVEAAGEYMLSETFPELPID